MARFREAAGTGWFFNTGRSPAGGPRRRLILFNITAAFRFRRSYALPFTPPKEKLSNFGDDTAGFYKLFSLIYTHCFSPVRIFLF